MAEDWKRGLLVKLPKTVDTTHCKNTLLVITSKATTLVTRVGKKKIFIHILPLPTPVQC